MKKFIKIISLFFASMLCFCCFFGCQPKKSEEQIARLLIEKNSTVELPTDSEIVYHLRDKRDKWQGMGFQYTVFELESEPEDWLNENSFENSLNEEKSNQFERFFSSALQYMPNEIGDIQQEFLPDFDEQYYYLKTDNVYFVCLPQDLLLIVIIPSN